MGKEGVSKEVLLDGAQMNLSALIVGTMSFLKQKHIPIKDWVLYIGKQFEDSWGGMEGEKAERILEHLLTLEVLPLGVVFDPAVENSAEKLAVLLRCD